MDWKTTALFGSLFLFGTLELVFPFFQFEKNLTQRIATNIGLGLINVLVTTFTTTLLLKWVWQQTNWLGLFHAIQAPWLVFILSVLLIDSYMYCWHRLMHMLPIGWRFHRVHHAETTMNVSTTYRFHTFEVILSNLPKIFLVWLFGIPPICYLIYEVLYTIETIFHHSNWNLPYKVDRLLSYVIVTPNYHRFHHSQRLSDSQTNYASFLTCWDKIFKSRAYPKAPKMLQLGLSKQTKDDLVSMLLLPF